MLNPMLRQQSLARTLSDTEIAFAAALEAVFADKAHDPAAAAVALQARGVARPSGSSAPWDEAALRDVVRDVIREEFQGLFGERITRNVRKLVRAELNRALASRDMV